MAYTDDLDTDLNRVRGLLTAFGLEKRIRIAYDEWNLRSWHHPNVHTPRQGITKDEYITPRDLNDRNCDYTMADAVFTACFLNTLNRNSDIVGMACFAPVVNTRGCVFTHPDGIVLRGTYHVYDLYVHQLGDEILEGWTENLPRMEMPHKNGGTRTVDALDVLATRNSADGSLAIAAINKHPTETQTLTPVIRDGTCQEYRVLTVNGESTESYNDIGINGITLREGNWQPRSAGPLRVALSPHSVNIIQIR